MVLEEHFCTILIVMENKGAYWKQKTKKVIDWQPLWATFPMLTRVVQQHIQLLVLLSGPRKEMQYIGTHYDHEIYFLTLFIY